METSVKDRSSVLSRYFSEIREYPLLTKDEEMALADGVKRGDRASLNELISRTSALSSRSRANTATSACRSRTCSTRGTSA
jgi:DNA-directed RNA polymerase sigma subunit (sigma70/sigma32)